MHHPHFLAFLWACWAENTCWRPHFCCHGNFYWSHLFFSWEHLMEGTRGAVKNRFSFVSPRSASVTVTESITATESQNILCGKNKRIWGSILDCFLSGGKPLEATLYPVVFTICAHFALDVSQDQKRCLYQNKSNAYITKHSVLIHDHESSYSYKMNSKPTN